MRLRVTSAVSDQVCGPPQHREQLHLTAVEANRAHDRLSDGRADGHQAMVGDEATRPVADRGRNASPNP